MAEEKIYESKELLKKEIDTNNPESILDLIGQILGTNDDAKMKLFAMGEILTKNKNDTIYDLKGDIIRLNKRINNQRAYITKIKKALTVTQTKVEKANSHISDMSDRIDREAYQKACRSYDNNYSPKKKVVVVKKYSK